MIKKISKKRFPKVQGNYLLYYVPSITDPISMLACAINSKELKKILEEESIVNSESVNFKLSFFKKIKTDSPLRADVDKIYH